MCYFLYGAVNEGVNISDYNNAVMNSNFLFKIGTADDVNSFVKNCGTDYRITSEHCDCHTSIGCNDANNKELENYKELLLKFRTIRGIKYVLLSKNWWKNTNSKHKAVHIDDIDISNFLSNIKEDCLYKLELYPRFF
ncbi:MAG: hypothetical protein IKB73_03880 [Ruminococcus sp.]|nr:hypothetical protein [Ruminococcus sp.]